jgi:RNA polymerase sigma-70 factor (ECF subfamily)
LVSWDEAAAEERYAREPSRTLTPERLFDQEWARTLIAKAQAALRRECAAGGQAAILEALEDFLVGSPAAESWKAVAARLNLTEGAVRMRVQRLKQRFGTLLREQVADTVTDEREAEDELRPLFAAWS